MCGVLRYAHRTPGRKRSHWHPNLAACLHRMVFSVRLNRSTAPSHCGWYAVVFNLVMPSIRHKSSIKLDRRLVPRSESRHSGTPNIGITSSAISLEIQAVFWSGTAKTIGHLVKRLRSCITTTCLLPWSVTGRSITSMPRIWNGLDTGMGCNGDLFTLPLPVAMAHSGQDFTNFLASLNIPSHHHRVVSVLWRRWPEKWPE